MLVYQGVHIYLGIQSTSQNEKHHVTLAHRWRFIIKMPGNAASTFSLSHRVSEGHRFRRGWKKTGWWFQSIWKISVKMGIFPNFQGENKKYLKPPRVVQKLRGMKFAMEMILRLLATKREGTSIGSWVCFLKPQVRLLDFRHGCPFSESWSPK